MCSRIFTLFRTILAALSLAGHVQCLQCYFDTNTTQITELPKMVTCQCQQTEEEVNELNVNRDIFDHFNRELISSIESISINSCGNLVANLSVDDDFQRSGGSRPIDLVIDNVDRLELILGNAERYLQNVSLTNVSSVETSLNQPEIKIDYELISLEEIYFYTVIGLASLLIISWIVMLVLIICLCKRRGKNNRHGGSSCCVQKRRKKVSRAESWRYESNIYVHPNQRQQPQFGRTRQHNPDYGMTNALQQMLPYHLVPQREATLLAQHPFEPAGQQHATKITPGHQPLLGRIQEQGESDHNDPSFTHGDYTDSSLQYADDDGESEFEDASLQRPQGHGQGHRNEDEQSNANSASYGSRNQASTLPLPNYPES